MVILDDDPKDLHMTFHLNTVFISFTHLFL